ncbi:DUF1045 domain-containing protein [Bradyrhizobium cosmicum]|nr:DUF1045 domain-containing protein [Bradyrhizobium cosmicum]
MCLVRWGNPYVFDRFRFHMTEPIALPPIVRQELDGVFDSLFLDN